MEEGSSDLPLEMEMSDSITLEGLWYGQPVTIDVSIKLQGSADMDNRIESIISELQGFIVGT
jgi:hypothetical protein